MNDKIKELIAAARELPADVDMVEHNPDEGTSYFCCGNPVTFCMHPSRGSGFVHLPDCWYVRLTKAIKAVDDEA